MAWLKTAPTNDELLINFPALCRANWEAIELGTDANLLITNAKCAAAMGLVDTKLAQITTASKVSGSSLTLLANIPSGAGLVPVVNIPNLSTDKLTSGILPLARGGTNSATQNFVDISTEQLAIAGNKTFTGTVVLNALALGGNMAGGNYALNGVCIENRTNDTGCTQSGRIWFRTDV